MKNLSGIVAILAAAALASGCAGFGAAGVAPGSTVADVERALGLPNTKLAQANGDSVWFYPGGRHGRQTYAVRVGSDGVVRDIEQRLTENNIQKIVADKTTIKEVRELMGPPYQVAYFPLKQHTSWEYPMVFGSISDWMILWVNFSDDGVVREVLYMRDPEKDWIEPGGDWN